MNQIRLHGLLFSSDSEVVSVMDPILRGFAIDTEVCAEYGPALETVSRRGLDIVVVDWKPAHHPTRVVSAARGSSPNVHSTIVAVVNGSSEVQAALLSGVNFVIHKPANVDHARRCVKAAYGTMLQQRRRSARCPVDIPVVATAAGSGKLDARITDISIGGLAMQCGAVLQIGWTIAVCFSLPGMKQRLDLTGRVVNADKNGRAGLSFLNLAERDLSSLIEWLAVELSKLDNTEIPGEFLVPSGEMH